MKKNLIDPYEPCPCGSGKKYKFCCKGKEDQGFITPSEFNSRIQKLATKKMDNKCIFCGKDAINSHSIPRSIQEDSLQSTGNTKWRVYTFKTEFTGKELNELCCGEKIETEIFDDKTIASMSVSKSFCKSHDNSIFAPIEKNNIYIKTEETDFIYAYRAFAKHYYEKQELLNTIRSFFELQPHYSAHDEEIVNDYRRISEKDIENKALAEFFKENYISKNFKSISGKTITSDTIIHFATSFVFCAYSKNNNVYFDADEGTPFFVNIFPEAKTGKSHIIINWITDDTDNRVKNFILNQLNGNDIEKFLTMMMLTISNNIAFNYDIGVNLEDGLEKEFLYYRDLKKYREHINYKEDCKINLFSEDFWNKYSERQKDDA